MLQNKRKISTFNMWRCRKSISHCIIIFLLKLTFHLKKNGFTFILPAALALVVIHFILNHNMQKITTKQYEIIEILLFKFSQEVEYFFFIFQLLSFKHSLSTHPLKSCNVLQTCAQSSFLIN